MSFRIGSIDIKNPYILAPMASVSEMPFRVLAMDLGAALAPTELISAKGIFYKNRRTFQYLTYDPIKEVPYSVQLFGGDIEVMASAAHVAWKHGADMIDINMGCPVKKVTKTGSGSALMMDPQRAADMIREMILATENQVPITAKIRSGWDNDNMNFIDMAQAMEKAGVAAVAMHARTRAQAYRGEADWGLIKELKDAVDVPVIGNGDVLTPADAYRMQEQTRCDGVMIGRGALGNPWIFRALEQGLANVQVSHEERRELIKHHLTVHTDFHLNLDKELHDCGQAPTNRQRSGKTITPEIHAVRTFRQHLIWYSRGFRGGSAFRKQVLQMESFDEVLEAVELFFSHASPTHLVQNEDVEGINYKQAFG
jgi:tRNA-dihydrouridine synthase B